MSDKLMDTAPGGESTQYESIKTVTNAPQRDEGQLGSQSTTTPEQQAESRAKEVAEKGERTAENVRYGQGISEQGFGGVTTGAAAAAGKEDGDEAAKQTRQQQGYGSGSGVGA